MKRASVMGLVWVLVLGFTCVAWAGSAVDGIKKAGVLKIASTVTGVPTTFLDTKSGKVVGIMVDIAQEIADYLGVKLEVVETAWSALIPSLQANKVDLICAAMVVTEERKKVMTFSDPAYPLCEALVVKESDKKNYTTYEDLKGLNIGTQVGTLYTKTLEGKGVPVKVYDNVGDVLLELTNGRIDAHIGDGPIIKYLVKNKPNFKVRLVESYKPFMCADIAVGMSKDSPDLLAEVNKVVAQLKSSGKMNQILAKWGYN